MQPVAILNCGSEELVLRIWIGPTEEQDILFAQAKEKSEVAMTSEVMARLIAMSSNLTVKSITIHDLREIQNQLVFLSQIDITQGVVGKTVPIRPSNAIPLAIRMKMPVFINKDIFGKVPEMALKPESTGLIIMI
jgi:bifunctional DNase/RNase